jgi:GNAT superfamily N-acetyltransferase
LPDAAGAGPQAPAGGAWVFHEVSWSDAEVLAGIRAAAMRPSLERLNVWDEAWARARFLRDFDPSCAWGISVGSELVGCIALRPDGDEFWLEHFLLLPPHQGRGIGTQALTAVLDHAGGRAVRLNVLQRSEARALYERFGFQLDHEDSMIAFMTRPANLD